MIRISSVLLFAFTAIAFTACATDPGDGEDLPSAGVQVDDTVTAQDMAYYDMSTVEAGPTDMVLSDDTLSTTDATLTRGDRAIIWYQNHKGSTAYEGLCELAAELSFGTRGRFPSAIDNWNWEVNHGRAHKGDRTAPRGALVFWRTSVFGHVAVADGNGGEWSTSVNGRIGHASSTFYFSNYLGWSWAPPSWPGR